MKTLYVSILSICFYVNALCQDYHKVDSLKKILLTSQEDTIKGSMIWALTKEYMWIKPDTTLYYSNMGLALIKNQEIKNEFQIYSDPLLRSFEIRMYEKSAIAYAVQRNDSLALKLAFKALKMAEKSKDKMDVPRVYGVLGDAYSEIGEPALP